jgi:SAM-dependent methyltransferase
MSSFDDPSFTGDNWARRYPDADLSDGPDPGPAVAFLAELAGPGARVLELAVGGGRVARPLSRAGVRVEGVEASAEVARRLAASPEGDAIPVVVADMADVPVDGPFDVVYVVWNSLYNLGTQERQVECVRNVARVLRPGGTFVTECFVPDLAQYDRQVVADDVTEESVALSVYRHEPHRQLLTKQRVTLTEQGIRLLPVRLRYLWPSELDLMARLAGLRLRARYGDWRRTPFGPVSTDHVSVYELA